VQKLKSAQKAFTLGVKAKIEKKKTFHSAPSLLINAELYGLVLAPRLKKTKGILYHQNLRGQFATQKCSKFRLKIFLGPDS
jgi:hypothetical protein